MEFPKQKEIEKVENEKIDETVENDNSTLETLLIIEKKIDTVINLFKKLEVFSNEDKK